MSEYRLSPRTALDGTQPPWDHPYESADQSMACRHCGWVGSYAHTAEFYQKWVFPALSGVQERPPIDVERLRLDIIEVLHRYECDDEPPGHDWREHLPEDEPDFRPNRIDGLVDLLSRLSGSVGE